MKKARAHRQDRPAPGDRRRAPGGLRAAATTAALVAVACVACAPDPSPTPRAERTEDTPGDEADFPRARYVTTLSFLAANGPASGGALPEARVMWFTNRTSPATLRRAYRGWDGSGGGWRPVLQVADSLPVPRAAWRVLPTDGLRVRISPDGQLAGLTLRGAGGSTRLDLGPALATWHGSTGQQESLRRAVLRTDSTSVSGVMATLRFNRLVEEGGPPGPGRLLLVAVADGSGSGLAALAGPARHAPWNRVITWSDSGSESWPALEAAVGLDSVAPGEAWSFRIPHAGISGRIEWSERRIVKEGNGEIRLVLGRGQTVGPGRRRPARALYVHQESPPLSEPPD